MRCKGASGFANEIYIRSNDEDVEQSMWGARKISAKLGDVSFQISNFLMHGLIFQLWY